ncbi:hypothetical protein KKE60_05000 [Patescibacteria group bacterium]|nr:hypothetical protein [Patescibacteria group bacterium]
MRIAMVSAHFELQGDDIPIGGVQRHISRVSAALRERGHEVLWTYPGLHIHRDVVTRVESAVEWADAVVAHDFCSWCAPDKANLMVFHGWEGVCPPNPPIIQRRQEIARDAGATIAVGAFIPKWYRHEVDEVIWGAADPPGPEEAAMEVEPELAVWVGRLERDTGCLDVIGWAMRQGFRVEVYGDGSLRVSLERLRDSIPGARAILYGNVPDAARHFRRAAIALPSGLLTLLEAQVRGKACFVTADNDLKHDYWLMHPWAPHMIEGVTAHPGELSLLSSASATGWAAQQTWGKIADIYLRLLEAQ